MKFSVEFDRKELVIPKENGSSSLIWRNTLRRLGWKNACKISLLSPYERKYRKHLLSSYVPSCCSCHIQGYAYLFPPLKKEKDHKFAGSERIDEFIPIDPPNLEEISRKAPPFSPVNFPNVPEFIEERTPVERKRPTNRLRTNAHQQWKPRRRSEKVMFFT
ncbi:hypothetical protein Anas_06832 [Armadillidium nasatum]|uniref:Uncharacterized protein n=1 Tax=Armadillidium nasatum TaxID=96803 RepID=A0A5N5TBD4_9CRUS|nr:hypothetical protein Anas_06832 [Armadillidium nasatum]